MAIYRQRRSNLLIAAVLMVLAASAVADPPQSLDYQAYLTDRDGRPVTGSRSITFRIYDAETDGTLEWSDQLDVEVTDGLFSAELGRTNNPLPKASFGDQLWLGVEIGDDGEAVPRRALNAVGNAFHSEESETVGGRTAASLDQSATVAQNAAVIGMNATGIAENTTAISTNASNQNAHASDGLLHGGGGDITAVNAGTGLDGGGSSGSVTLSVEIPFELSGSTTLDALVTVDNSGFGGGGIDVTNGSDRNAAVTAHNISLGGVGVKGIADLGDALRGKSESGRAGYFQGDVEASKNDGRLVLRTPSHNDPDRYGIQFDNNNLAPFLGDDTEDQYFNFYTGFSPDRAHDSYLRIHGSATGDWGNYLELAHDGEDGTVETDEGDIILRPAGKVRIHGADNDGTAATLQLTSGSQNMLLDGNEIDSVDTDGTGGSLYLNRNSSGNVHIGTGGGHLVTPVLRITGGADLSEHFDVTTSPDAQPARPGMVVSIDPDKPGALTVSRTSYDRKVVGIISGAGGVNPGMIMSQEGTIAHGKNPVALTGRVFCLADADRGGIRPGDLLTTSSTPGHAMKVTDYGKAHGAILGKAMSALEQGRGLVLVLVTLQ